MGMLRAAVIGAGFVGRAHIESLRRQGIPVIGVLGSSRDRAAESARALRIDRVYSSLDELAKDKEVDVVHICTPNHLHAEQTTVLMRAGKHVMCEKPLAMNTKESAQLIDLARKENRVGGVTYNLRYYPLCQQARAMVDAGAIGSRDWYTAASCKTGCYIPQTGTGGLRRSWAAICERYPTSARIGWI
jgi:predicted dehydrogenase